MIPAATFDPARRLDFYFRIEREGTNTLRFYDADGADFHVDTLDFEFFIKKYPGDNKDVLRLTAGAGLTIIDNTIIIEVLPLKVKEGEYYCELYRPDTDVTWLSGKAFFHNGVFDGASNSNTGLTISENGVEVLITINDDSVIINQAINIDGGTWDSVYTIDQSIDGGTL